MANKKLPNVYVDMRPTEIDTAEGEVVFRDGRPIGVATADGRMIVYGMVDLETSILADYAPQPRTLRQRWLQSGLPRKVWLRLNRAINDKLDDLAYKRLYGVYRDWEDDE